MSRVHRASGVRKQDLVSRAKALRDSVDSLLPRLSGDAPRDRFDRLRAELEEVRESRDDAKRLEKLSHRGDDLPRAYAGLLRYYLDPTTPTVVPFRLPDGEASYAALSRAPREAELAVQQGDDPYRLLLGYFDWSRRGLHFYATRRHLYCTGRSPQPPEEFLSEKVADLPYRLSARPGGHDLLCSHLLADEPRPFLEVGWPSGERVFRVCRRCVKEDRHLFASLSEGVAVPDPSEAFPVRAELNVRCRAGESCLHAHLPGLPRGVRRDYDLGRLSDAAFLDAYLAEVKPYVEGTRDTTYVAGGVCYGGDLAAFLDALHPTPVERRALTSVLESFDGYFEVDEPAASRALDRLWGQHAEAIVSAIVDDPAEARRVLQEARAAPGRAAEILKRAQRRGEERELLGALPRYARLSPEAAWVDAVAREFRTHQGSGAERVLLQTLPREGKERGLAYALLLALGRAAAHAWQFTPTEQEFGSSLETPARTLLSAPVAHYHDALDELLRSAGVADWGTLA